MDHQEARIFHIYGGGSDQATITSPPQSTHHKHSIGDEGKLDPADDTKRFFHEIAGLIGDAEEILVVGPSKAKLEFVRHVHKHHHALEPKIIGLETMEHPSDAEILAHAKVCFKRMLR